MALHASYFESNARQIGGADVQRINPEDLAELAPECTRVERALLLRTIADIDTAAQVSLRSRCARDSLQRA